MAGWAELAVSLILSALGVHRRNGILLVLAGVLSLGFCLVGALSVGPLVSILPFLQLALGAGYMAKASRRGMWALGGAALVFYGSVLADPKEILLISGAALLLCGAAVTRSFLSMHGA